MRLLPIAARGTGRTSEGRLLLGLAAAALLGLGGCSTPPATIKAGPVATLKGDPVAAPENFMGDEINCRMESIDGESVGATYQLRPGPHTLIVTLGSQGKEYVGIVNLLIPEPHSYRVTARRKEDAVTMSLMDEDAGRMVASSTAALADQMKFHVFVVQK